MNARLTARTAYRGAENANGLHFDEIQRVAPSVFAPAPHSSRSERYAFIPTVDVVKGLLAHGFVCTKAQQARSRIPGKSDFTKHLLFFTQGRQIDNAVRTEVPSVALLNSHDGSSRYKLLAGIIRYACLNGVLVADGFNEVSIPHSGNVGRIIEGSFEVIEGAKASLEKAQEWKQIRLDRFEQLAFASAARQLRWEDKAAPVTGYQLTLPRRGEDQGNDLWTTFNVVQENLIRGGQSGPARDAAGRRRSSRAVGAIDANVKLNRALWSLTERYAQLKSAA